MIPNITFGSNTYGLIKYLLGPGRKNEHAPATLVAGSARLLHQFSRYETLPKSLAASIAKVLDRNWNALIHPAIRSKRKNHVVHISLALPSYDKEVDDTTWENIAEEFMEKMGFTGDEVSPCRWIAFNHGKNSGGGAHIHIVANKTRADGRTWHKDFSFRQSQKICRELEEKYGLYQLTAAKEAKQGARWKSAAELNEQEQTNMALSEKEDIELRLRRALSISNNEADFVRNARRENLVMHPRRARGDKTRVVGYKVKIHKTRLWHAPSKIARDLALPNLRTHWPEPNGEQQRQALSAWANPKDIAPRLDWQSSVPEPDLDAERKYYHQLDWLVDNWLKQRSYGGATTSQLSYLANKLSGLIAQLAAKPGLDNTTHHALNGIALRLGKNAQYHTTAGSAHWRAPASAVEALSEQVLLIRSEQFVPQVHKMMKKLADIEDDRYLTNAQVALSQSIFQALADVHQIVTRQSHQQISDRMYQHVELAGIMADNEVEYFAYLRALGYEITKPEYTKKWWHIRHNRENIDYTIHLNDLGTDFKWWVEKGSSHSIQALETNWWAPSRVVRSLHLNGNPPTPPPTQTQPNQGPTLGT